MLEVARKILLISPQIWDASKVSKHHYARELTALGHSVYFVEPPKTDGYFAPVLRDGPHSGLKIVSYGVFFPYALKFHARPLFNILMRFQARKLVRAIGGPPDIVWDFDNSYQFSDLRVFDAEFSIFHPVDDLPPGVAKSKHADLILSNAQRYIDRLEPSPEHAEVIDHGLSKGFIDRARAIAKDPETAGRSTLDTSGCTIGYVGNLDRPGIDWDIIDEISRRLPMSRFVFIGPHGVSGNGPPKNLMDRGNAEFVGPKTSTQILEYATEFDGWLMAYDRARDLDGGTNPHKLLEYLATGKVVVSNWAESYSNKDVVIMPPDPDNSSLPDIMARTIEQIELHNASSECKRRASYALDFSYTAHLHRIGELIDHVRNETGA